MRLSAPAFCSPHSHSALRKLNRENRITAGLRPRNMAEPKRRIPVTRADGSVKIVEWTLHPTKGWRRIG